MCSSRFTFHVTQNPNPSPAPLLKKPELSVVDPIYFQAMEGFSELINCILSLNGIDTEMTSELVKQGANLYFKFSCDTSSLSITHFTQIRDVLKYVEQIELIPVKKGLLRLIVTVKVSISPEAYKRALRETHKKK